MEPLVAASNVLIQAVGHGDASCAPNAPTPIRALRGKGVLRIACGGSRSLALCNAGHGASKAGVQGSLKGPNAGVQGSAPATPVKAGSQPSSESRPNQGAAAAALAVSDVRAKPALTAQGQEASTHSWSCTAGIRRRIFVRMDMCKH